MIMKNNLMFTKSKKSKKNIRTLVLGLLNFKNSNLEIEIGEDRICIHDFDKNTPPITIEIINGVGSIVHKEILNNKPEDCRILDRKLYGIISKKCKKIIQRKNISNAKNIYDSAIKDYKMLRNLNLDHFFLSNKYK